MWWIPNLPEQIQMGEDLRVNPFQSHLGAQYLLENYFGSVVVHLFHLYPGRSYFIFLPAFTLLSLAIAFWLAHRKLGFEKAFFLFVLFLSLPVSTIVMTWMGLDTWTFLWMTLSVLSSSMPLLMISAFFLGTSHFFQGLLALGLLAFIQWRFGSPVRKTLFACVAVIVGRAALEMWFRVHSFEVQRNALTAMQEFHISNTAYSQWIHLPLFFLSTLGAGWLFAVDFYRNTSAEKRYSVIAVYLLLFALCFFVADHTRVFAMLSWPSLLWIGRNNQLQDHFSRWMLLACIIVPPVIIWNSFIYSSHLPADIEVVYRYFTHSLPENIMSIPYQ